MTGISHSQLHAMRRAAFVNAPLVQYDKLTDTTKDHRDGSITHTYAPLAVPCLVGSTGRSEGGRWVKDFRVQKSDIGREPKHGDRIFWNQRYWYIKDWSSDQSEFTFTVNTESA